MIIDYGIKNFLDKENIESENIYRIISRNKNFYFLSKSYGEEIKVSIRNCCEEIVIGDFVEIIYFEKDYHIIRKFKRNSEISKSYNKTKKSYNANENDQILASNIDQLFILIAADQRFTISKFERYLLTFSDVVDDIKILISKSENNANAEIIKTQINKIYPDIEVLFSDVENKYLMSNVEKLFKEDSTAIFIGSSGAGKSTLSNYLIESDSINTQVVRDDGKGKHTTTFSRIYFSRKTNSYIMDTPGFKGISTNRVVDTDILFKKINILSKSCKFSNCKHETEPRCAVKEAIENGELSKELYTRYLLLGEKEFKIKKFEEKNLIKKN